VSRRAVDTAFRIPRRLVAVAVVVVATALVFIVISFVARAGDPATVASPDVLRAQQAAAERDVERAYEQASAQVKRVRSLNLAITATQADQIATKAFADLKTLRHSAFVSLGQIEGLATSDAEQYALAVEGRFDAAPVLSAPSPTPVLLAPRLYAIVVRMSEVATQISDLATTQLTASPASPSPTPTNTATARPTPSPSPSR